MASSTSSTKTPVILPAGEAELEFFLNELSLDGQFPDLKAFEGALDTLMRMRHAIRAQGLFLRAHRLLGQRMAMTEQRMSEAVHRLPREKVTALLTWLSKEGPFWEDDRAHSCGDWLEIAGEAERIVTDAALGEAAWRRHLGETVEMIGFPHADWNLPSLRVGYRGDEGIEWEESIANHIAQPSLTASLEKALPPLKSWRELKERAVAKFANLFFAGDSFAKLDGTPFALGPADQLMRRLQILSNLKGSFSGSGGYTAVGEQLYQTYFVGGKAWFSDSSESEKNEFRNELRFRHPEKSGEYIDGFWHGKVKTPQLRIHFSWPVTRDDATYVLYVGPKITKR